MPVTRILESLNTATSFQVQLDLPHLVLDESFQDPQLPLFLEQKSLLALQSHFLVPEKSFPLPQGLQLLQPVVLENFLTQFFRLLDSDAAAPISMTMVAELVQILLQVLDPFVDGLQAAGSLGGFGHEELLLELGTGQRQVVAQILLEETVAPVAVRDDVAYKRLVVDLLF